MFSLSPLTVLPCSPIEQIDAAHVAGFDAVGLRLLPVMDTDLEVMADAALRRNIERRLQSTRLQVLDVEVVRVGPETDIQALLPVLEFARDIGARTITVTSLPRQEYAPRSEPLVVRKLIELCELAQRNHIKPMLEFMVFRGIATLQDAIRFVHMVGHPAMGICLDALHLARSGGSPSALLGLDPAILHCVQLCDAPATPPRSEDIPIEARSGRLFPGQGGLPLRELLDALPREIPVSIEVPSASSSMTIEERALEAARSGRTLLGSVRP